MKYINLDVDEYKLSYKVYLRNKISFLIGDSATGKSRFVGFLERYNRNKELGIGVNQDIRVSSSFKNVYTVENNGMLQEAIKGEDSLIIVDEMYMNMILSNLDLVKKSSNFFLFIFRDLIKNVTTGIYDILEFSSSTKNGVTENTTRSLYSFEEYSINPEYTLVEDSGSGFKFYSRVLNVKCLSAKGKTRVIKNILRLLQQTDKDILVIVDEVGFGYEFSKFMSYDLRELERVYFWCPYSFEYVLLNSGMFANIGDIFEECDWCKYSTVEKFVEGKLGRLLKERNYCYNKGSDIYQIFQGYISSIFGRNFDNYEKLLK